MNFNINEVVIYDSESAILFPFDKSNDMVTLTRISNDLLFLFVKNNNVSLRRDYILNELWEKRGLSASSNNLNNYVSMLRKALEKFGLVGLITTIPKFGFIFEADIVIVNDNYNFFRGAENNIIKNEVDSHPKKWMGLFNYKFGLFLFFVLFFFQNPSLTIFT